MIWNYQINYKAEGEEDSEWINSLFNEAFSKTSNVDRDEDILLTTLKTDSQNNDGFQWYLDKI